MNTILVLGASGNIGSFLVQDLIKMNADIIAGVPATEMEKLEKQGIKTIEVNFNDPKSLERGMQQAVRLFMLLPMHLKMIDWGRNIVNAALKTGITFLVRSSLMDARTDSPYALYSVHGQIDQIVRESGIPYSIVHPNSFMQNFVNYYRGMIVNDSSFYFAENDAAISYNDVRDIAAVDARILADPVGHENKEYDVTGPQALTNFQIAEILSSVTGRDIRYNPVDPGLYRRGLEQSGMPAWSIEMNMSLQDHIRDGKSARVTDTVKRITGRDPITFEQFARENAKYWEKVPAKV